MWRKIIKCPVAGVRWQSRQSAMVGSIGRAAGAALVVQMGSIGGTARTTPPRGSLGQGGSSYQEGSLC